MTKQQSEGHTSSRPNIIVLIADDLRAASVTPRLMPFSFEFFDTHFSQCYSPSTWTLPSHASLFSGTDPTEHGITRTGDKLSTDQAVLPRRARSAGYTTALFSENPFFSGHRGFGHDIDFVNDHINYKTNKSEFSIANYVDNPTSAARAMLSRLLVGDSRMSDLVNSTYAVRKYLSNESESNMGSTHNTTRVLSHLEDYLAAQTGTNKPALSFVNLLETHNPHTVIPESARELGIEFSTEEIDGLNEPDDDHEYLFGNQKVREPFEDWEHLYQRKLSAYQTSIHRLDGLLEDFIANIGTETLSDSLLVLTGDHGELFGEEEMVGHQTSLHPAGVQVPLLVKYPDGWTERETSVNEPVNWTGLSKTLGRLVEGEVSGAASFREILVSASRNSDTESIVCAVDGPNWDIQALEQRYGEQIVSDLIKVRRVGLIQKNEMTVYESKWGSDQISERHYQLSDGERSLVDEQEGQPASTRLQQWLGDEGNVVSHDVSQRLKDLGYA
ncbi:sulfatase-like hydrolase/transferase [Haloterrigena salifodinae]|uniref:Sulfatase-like hydrolase/transferase n=1 Tax=Haloterrigena salifodinae TaxID=2675099 RepID=A0A8T8E321_9EURY|nr:sulfatase-like hydrolase/transferase [Haloterrigena salifodinae]QRV15791.1 sulfatase-like hydrolase/transferase [Haloterrigena salifodinae]